MEVPFEKGLSPSLHCVLLTSGKFLGAFEGGNLSARLCISIGRMIGGIGGGTFLAGLAKTIGFFFKVSTISFAEESQEESSERGRVESAVHYTPK